MTMAGLPAYCGPKGHTTRVSLTRRSMDSLYASLSHFGLIILLCYVCEFHPPHYHAEKVYDRDAFFFLTLLLILCASLTIERNGPAQAKAGSGDRSKTKEGRAMEKAVTPPDSTILNRAQTEEWKGWMQFMFLLYHYYAASETYNSIRIMITCYVWMTGFGNFSFFYLKRDYSLTRVLQMLWRLNFLVAFLCLGMGNTYVLYYICPLHTFFFGVVYCSMR